jgi:ATP-dependent RNA helicase DeaD
MKTLKFNELSLSEEIQKAIDEMGFVDASPIQSQAIPFILEGRDVIGQAQTGTGKTAAFGIPALEMIDPSNKSVQTVVMCPTRELALQVSLEFKKLAKYIRGINVLAIYGGESIEKQISNLKRGVQVVIGTPGRIMDHLERKTLKFDNVKMIVLDEADEMLNMGFREDIETILSKMPAQKQTIFFSATMAKPIMALTKKYQVNPEIVKVTRDELTMPSIEQIYYEVRGSNKMEVMTRIIDLHNLKLMLVFCNTKKKVDEVVDELNASGHKAEGIHGDLRQNQRNMVMSKFRNGQVNILVATDVAARGIDVDNVDAVINYDLPLDDEYYVHRIGRTGRAGKTGKAFTFVTARETGRLREIQHFTKVKIQKGEMPTAKELAAYKRVKFMEKVSAVIETADLSKFDTIVEEFEQTGLSASKLASALLKMSMGPEEREVREVREEYRDRTTSRRDREPSREREERGNSEFRPKRERRSRADQGKMVRLFINVGKMDKIRPGDIVGALTGETGIEGSIIGPIDIYDKFSFVEIPEDNVQNVLEGMTDNQIKGRKISIEVAKSNY